MPVYDFACRDCESTFVITCSVEEHERQEVRCPECESSSVERIWSRVFVETSKKS